MKVLLITVAIIGLTVLILTLRRKIISFLFKGRIEVTRVQLSDDGSLVDISYLVRKPGRIVDDPSGIYLLDELRVKKIKAESAYQPGNVIDINTRLHSTGNIQLPNKHKVIKKGSFVTVAIGEYRREHLIVV